ncbi:hypothetical protein ACIBG8_46750 [Nonomuraea sp. NPDC050556]|uniref:hypothetical protein n=1 Tax=Nonomuraea sp. NPDC050556 TaxID=3364369 RepID=UPI0037AD1AA0
MTLRLLWNPLPDAWPAEERERPRGWRGLLAWLRTTPTPETDLAFERRMRRAATQALVCEAYRQIFAEQDTEHRRPTEFALAVKTRLTAFLTSRTVEVDGWSEITIADIDPELAWSLYAAIDRDRTATIAQANATHNRPRPGADTSTVAYEFSITSGDEDLLGVVQYQTCDACGIGLLRKISFSLEWQYCGLGTFALRQLETRHPHLTWYTTGQYSHVKRFYERYRQGSTSPWAERQNPCPHF